MSVPHLPGYVVAPLTAADAADWAAFALLPEVQQLTSSSAKTVDDLLPMIERAQSPDPNAPRLFGVRDAAGELVAVFGFHTVSAANRTAEITYTVRPASAGRGLATAICGAGVRWAFGVQHWVRVQATTLVAHAASQRVLHKCGFAYEGTLRNFRLVRGVPADYRLYARVPEAAGG